MTEWVASLGLWWYVLFFLFVQLINVVLNTFKTIITARGTVLPAATINAVTFGFYTLVVALTADMSNIWVNMAITVIANFFGVCFSFWLLKKLQKDKLWEIVATVNEQVYFRVRNAFKEENIPFTMVRDNANHYVFNIYSANQKQSVKIKEILQKYKAKYIVHQEEVRL